MASSHGSSAPRASQRPLRRWARFATHHPWQVVGAWVVVVAILATLATTIGGTFADKFSVPGTESQQALDTLKERFPALSGDTAQVVFRSDTDIRTDPAAQAKITAFIDQAKQLPEVVGVASPLDPTTPTISQDGTIAYATIQYPKPGVELKTGTVDALLALVKASNSTGFQAEVGGQVVFSVPETGPSEIVGIIAAVIILLITFGSVVAMGLPIITAGVGVGLSVVITTILASVIDFSTITTALISMMGLGVGIDYALFIISRFREERAGGRSIEEATVTAIDTAGRAVLFAGTVVVIALLGLFSVGIPFIGFLGLGGAIAVATSMTIAVGLMPALLRLLGRFMDRWTIYPNRHRPAENTFGYKLTSTIQKAPLAWLLAALVLLGALGWSAIFDVHLGSSDAGTNPADTTTRKAYDLIAQGFGPGANGPLLVVVENGTGSPLDQTQLAAFDKTLAGTQGVAFTSQPIPNQQGDTAVIQVIPLTAPQDKATENLIHRLRNDIIPQETQNTDLKVYIGGSTATFADLATATSSRLPLYIAIVAGLSILILMTVFRSILIPIKAALANLLSFFAGYGVMVLVFQKGAFGINDWIGVDRTGPIESFLPIFLFGILFGLSMDYEIFLISRVHEAWTHRQDNAWALRHGIGSSGRVVLAAGAIMTSVFLAFTLGDSRIIKELGLGLGMAIMIDVLVVRMIVVPSFMSLMGRANWWLPAWLDRILPRLEVEGESAPGEFDDESPAPTGTAIAPAR